MSGMIVGQLMGLINIFIGIFLMLSMTIFLGALATYFARLGTWPTHRDDTFVFMKFGIAVLFDLLVVLGVVRLLQHVSGWWFYVTVAIIAALVIWLIVSAFKKKK